jgi:hypothetical protein
VPPGGARTKRLTRTVAVGRRQASWYEGSMRLVSVGFAMAVLLAVLGCQAEVVASSPSPGRGCACAASACRAVKASLQKPATTCDNFSQMDPSFCEKLPAAYSRMAQKRGLGSPVECGGSGVIAGPSAPVESGGECAHDADCKGDRVCDRGRCASPR